MSCLFSKNVDFIDSTLICSLRVFTQQKDQLVLLFDNLTALIRACLKVDVVATLWLA